MVVRNLHGEELVYPCFNPPRRMLLQNQGANEYRNSVARYGSNAIFPPTFFYHTIVKELTAADISSGVLVSFTLHFFFYVVVRYTCVAL
jgi:hypothetical protein